MCFKLHLNYLKLTLGITFCFFLDYSGYTSNNNTLILLDSIKSYNLSSNVSVLEDFSSLLSLSDIQSKLYSQKFISNNRRTLDFGITNSVYWMKINLVNQSSFKNWILAIDYALLQEADLFLKINNKQYIKKSSGSGISFSQHEIDSRNIAFNVKIDSSQTIYLRCESKFPLKIPLTLYTVESYYKKESIQLCAFATYYGIVLVILIINLFYFFYLKDSTFILYCLAIASVAMGLATDNGLAFMFLWPDHPSVNLLSNVMMSGVAAYFMLLFARKLLLSKVYAPIADKIAFIMQWINVLYLVLSFFYFGKYTLLFSGFLTFSSFPVVIYLGLTAWKEKFIVAKYYMIGWFGLITGVTIYVFSLFSIIIPNEIGSFGLYIGSILEAIFFMISTGVRYKLAKSNEIDYKLKLEAYQKQMKDKSDLTNLHLPIPKHFAPLSKREKEVLAHISFGSTDKEIAEHLFVSITTIKTHARNIYGKLDVKNRTEAVAMANKYNLIVDQI